MKTYFCSEVRVLALSKISTSVAIGFYIRNGHEYAQFKPKLQALAKRKNSIFSVHEKSMSYEPQPKSQPSNPQMVHLNDEDEDGFEMI